MISTFSPPRTSATRTYCARFEQRSASSKNACYNAESASLSTLQPEIPFTWSSAVTGTERARCTEPAMNPNLGGSKGRRRIEATAWEHSFSSAFGCHVDGEVLECAESGPVGPPGAESDAVRLGIETEHKYVRPRVSRPTWALVLRQSNSYQARWENEIQEREQLVVDHFGRQAVVG